MLDKQGAPNVGDRVTIKLTGKQGEVDAIFTDRQGVRYCVKYENNQGEIVDRYFVAGELDS